MLTLKVIGVSSKSDFVLVVSQNASSIDDMSAGNSFMNAAPFDNLARRYKKRVVGGSKGCEGGGGGGGGRDNGDP